MNTFFFGYLSLKWRRLIRSITILIVLLFYLGDELGICPIRYYCLQFDYVGGDWVTYMFILLPIIPISFISWIVKPFVVKEKS